MGRLVRPLGRDFRQSYPDKKRGRTEIANQPRFPSQEKEMAAGRGGCNGYRIAAPLCSVYRFIQDKCFMRGA